MILPAKFISRRTALFLLKRRFYALNSLLFNILIYKNQTFNLGRQARWDWFAPKPLLTDQWANLIPYGIGFLVYYVDYSIRNGSFRKVFLKAVCHFF